MIRLCICLKLAYGVGARRERRGSLYDLSVQRVQCGNGLSGGVDIGDAAQRGVCSCGLGILPL